MLVTRWVREHADWAPTRVANGENEVRASERTTWISLALMSPADESYDSRIVVAVVATGHSVHWRSPEGRANPQAGHLENIRHPRPLLSTFPSLRSKSENLDPTSMRSRMAQESQTGTAMLRQVSCMQRKANPQTRHPVNIWHQSFIRMSKPISVRIMTMMSLTIHFRQVSASTLNTKINPMIFYSPNIYGTRVREHRTGRGKDVAFSHRRYKREHLGWVYVSRRRVDPPHCRRS